MCYQVQSPVASLTLYSCDGQPLKVTNLTGSDQITMSLQNQVSVTPVTNDRVSFPITPASVILDMAVIPLSSWHVCSNCHYRTQPNACFCIFL